MIIAFLFGALGPLFGGLVATVLGFEPLIGAVLGGGVMYAFAAWMAGQEISP